MTNLILSDSAVFLSEEVKMTSFTSLSVSVSHWDSSCIFDMSVFWLISGGFEYIAWMNILHLVLKSWHKSSSVVYINGIFFISLNFVYLYAWKTSFLFAFNRNWVHEFFFAILIA